MLYHLQPKKREPRGFFSKFIIGILIVVLIFVLVLLFSGTIRGYLAPHVTTSWNLRNNAVSGAGSFFASLAYDKRKLYDENKKLKEELRSFREIEIISLTLREENDALRKFFGVKSSNNVKVAPILSKPPFSPPGMILIGVGLSDGVQRGDLVIDQNGAALGNIAVVDETQSRVVLFSASGKNTRASLESGEMFSISGRGNSSFSFEAPRGFEIEKGSIVYISGMVPVAVVSHIEENKNSPFSTVYLEAITNINSINYVAVKIE